MQQKTGVTGSWPVGRCPIAWAVKAPRALELSPLALAQVCRGSWSERPRNTAGLCSPGVVPVVGCSFWLDMSDLSSPSCQLWEASPKGAGRDGLHVLLLPEVSGTGSRLLEPLPQPRYFWSPDRGVHWWAWGRISRSFHSSLDSLCSVPCHSLHSPSAALAHCAPSAAELAPPSTAIQIAISRVSPWCFLPPCGSWVKSVNEVCPLTWPAFIFIWKWRFSSEVLCVSRLPPFPHFAAGCPVSEIPAQEPSVGPRELPLLTHSSVASGGQPCEKRCSWGPPVSARYVCVRWRARCSFSRTWQRRSLFCPSAFSLACWAFSLLNIKMKTRVWWKTIAALPWRCALALAPCLVGPLVPAPRPSLRAGLAESPALAPPWSLPSYVRSRVARFLGQEPLHFQTLMP